MFCFEVLSYVVIISRIVSEIGLPDEGRSLTAKNTKEVAKCRKEIALRFSAHPLGSLRVKFSFQKSLFQTVNSGTCELVLPWTGEP